MQATQKTFLRNLLALALVCVSTVACQKKCQLPATTPFKSIVDTDWRLVESSDPDVNKSLSNYTFLIWHFDNSPTGNIVNVVNNLKYNAPVLTLNYNVNVDERLLDIQFVKPGAPDANGEPTAGSVQGETLFEYRLSNELNLTDTSKGYLYRFVPFTGIVNLDNKCVF